MFRNKTRNSIPAHHVTPKHFEENQRTLREIKDFCAKHLKKDSSCEASPVFVNKYDDNRPFVSVRLYDYEVTALLDSGANRSVVGNAGLEILEILQLKVQRTAHKFVTTADGARQEVSGVVSLPICAENTCKVISAFVVPSLKHSFILGSDFCREFRVSLDFGKEKWNVGNRMDRVSELHVTGTQPRGEALVGWDQFSTNEVERIQRVMKEFKTLGSQGKLGRTHKMVHHVDTGDAAPIKQKQYLMSPYMLEHLNRELDKMIEMDIVEPSMSEWSSPVLLVKKANGDYRFCFDGRKLNAVTKRDSYPLPFVDRILNMLSESKYISSVDLRSSFWQIPLSPESREKTAFAIPGRGLYHFKVLPFGLSNAAQCQQRLMDAVFGPELEPNVFVYLDDIIIVSKTFEEHLRLLKEVAKRLRDANLTVNLDKCEFFRPSLKYLGFVVDKNGLRTNPEKVNAMINFPMPRTTTEIKRFTGMCGWYRRFIPRFSTLMAPINELLKGRKKGQKISWTPEADRAFEDVKQALVSAPVLASPNFSLPFVLQCDASDTGLGSVLTQQQEGEEKVIAFASRSLSKSERNYSVTERECLAVVFACDKFRPFIEGTKFTVITDHASLKWLNKMKDPTGRLARWSVKLNQFDFEIIHRKGKFNVVPDALSRSPVEVPTQETEYLDAVETEQEHCIPLDIDLSAVDAYYESLRERITRAPDAYPQWMVRDNYIFKLIPTRVPVTTNVSEWKLLVPKPQRQKILQTCHSDPKAAHLGFSKTLSRVLLTYYWPKMRTDVYRFVRSCRVCNEQKSPNTARFGLMGKEKRCRFPWQIISVDLMGPFPRSRNGFTYLLVVTDWFTKYPLLKPLRSATSPLISKFMEDEVFLVYGVPQYILCDNGTPFISSRFKNLVKEYKSRIWYTARYHAQANFVERYNRTIGVAIRSYINGDHRSWDSNIPKIGFALRTAVHEVTKYSPAFLNFGRQIPGSGDYYGLVRFEDTTLVDCDSYARSLGKLSELYKEVQLALNKAYLKNQRTYDLRKRDVEFFVGDKVWKRNKVLSDASKGFTQKLAPKYVLCTVSKKLSKLVYALKHENGTDAGSWHVKDLKPYFGPEPSISGEED